jgi:DNA invertase Pin-like site-specific DNA recombinase
VGEDSDAAGDAHSLTENTKARLCAGPFSCLKGEAMNSYAAHREGADSAEWGRSSSTRYAPTLSVVGYVRVSTAEQSDSGLGLEAQRQALEAEAERRGWHIGGLFSDAGASGKSVNGRPGLQEALRAVERGEAQALVVAKLDRLSRSLLDFSALMERARKKGWNLIALDLGVDTSTPSGELMANVLATFAQFERRLIGQRTRDALAIVRQNGSRSGRPIGNPNFLSISATTGARILELREAGLSYRRIAERLNTEKVPTSQGGKRWHSQTIANIVARMSMA